MRNLTVNQAVYSDLTCRMAGLRLIMSLNPAINNFSLQEKNRFVKVRLHSLFGEDLDEVNERLCGFFQPAHGIKFQLAVKIMPARKEVRRRQA